MIASKFTKSYQLINAYTYSLLLLAFAMLFAILAVVQQAGAVTVPKNYLQNQRSLQIVAHQDDDLIFMNPDITKTISQGYFERTVYITAGNLGNEGSDTSYWQGREAGALAGHARMAGRDVSRFAPGGTGTQDIRSIFTLSSVPLAGGQYYMDVWTLNNTTPAGQVSVAFLRLPASIGNLNTYPLVDLWMGVKNQLTTVGTVSGSKRSYTKSQLVQYLSAIMAEYAPTIVRAQDAPDTWSYDHDDHVMAARFTLDAFNGYRAVNTAVSYEGYRGYNHNSGISGDVVEPENISSSDMTIKQAVLNAYCQYDVHTGGPGCFAHNWGPRQYSVQHTNAFKGELKSGTEGTERCLTENASRAYLTGCNGSPSQVWSVSPGGAITGSSGNCMQVPDLNNPLAAMAGCATATRWLVNQDGFIVGPGGQILVEASGALRLIDLYKIPSQNPGNHTNALGTMTNDGGNIPGAAAASAPKAPLSPTALRWAFHTQSSYLASYGQQFSDAHAWNTSDTYYGSIRLADVNGDSLADLCGRGSGGISCGLNDGSGRFGLAETWTSNYSNTGGWSSAQYGTTIQFADINGDGSADVCGRGSDGIVCGLADPTNRKFLVPQRVSYGRDFSDAYGWNTSATYYGSIRLADVNGDGYADVCGRGSGGISCGINDRTGRFGPAGTWTSSNYSNIAGWSKIEYGTTMQFADINGDGKADVCGRGSAGMVCGLSTGSSFSESYLWSFRNDFSNLLGWNTQKSYYGSIKLADINGDGKADLCGRAPTGIRCGYSTGSHFTVAITLSDTDFTDRAGYKPAQYGSTLQFGILTAGAHPSLCVRGISGEMCSKSF